MFIDVYTCIPVSLIGGISLFPGEIFYALDEDSVCRTTALMLLQNAVKFNLAEFLEVWQQSVPEGMGTRLDQLRVSLGCLRYLVWMETHWFY